VEKHGNKLVAAAASLVHAARLRGPFTGRDRAVLRQRLIGHNRNPGTLDLGVRLVPREEPMVPPMSGLLSHSGGGTQSN